MNQKPDILSELERRAWDTRDASDKHKPEMAPKVVLDDMARGELPGVRHILVVVVQTVADGDLVHLYQAGDLSEFAAEGALGRAVSISQQGA